MASGLLEERIAAHLPGRGAGQVALTGFTDRPESWFPDRDWHYARQGRPPSSAQTIGHNGVHVKERAAGRRLNAIFSPVRGPHKERAAAASAHHNLLDEMASMLGTAVDGLGSASIQDLVLACRARGTSLLVVVRSAESALQRCQQDRDRHIQSLGDNHEILDGPTGPAS